MNGLGERSGNTPMEETVLALKTLYGIDAGIKYNKLREGSKLVEKQIREEGLDLILGKAGFDIRQPGCSACLGMNEDKVPKGEYCVSTSNRNFEGRQGPESRTLLASPLTAAATAILGTVADVRTML